MLNFRLPSKAILTLILCFQVSAAGAESPATPPKFDFDTKRYLKTVSKYHTRLKDKDTSAQWPKVVDNPRVAARTEPKAPPAPPVKVWTAMERLERGLALHEENKLDLAEKEYLEAIKLDAAFAPAHFNLGILYAAAQLYPKAEKAYITTLKLDPALNEAHNNLGVVYAAQKKFRKAEREFRKALVKNPKDAKAHLNLGHFYYYLKNNMRKARKEYEAALKITPDVELARKNLGAIDKEIMRSMKLESQFEGSKKLDYEYAEMDADSKFFSEDIPPVEKVSMPEELSENRNLAPLF